MIEKKKEMESCRRNLFQYGMGENLDHCQMFVFLVLIAAFSTGNIRAYLLPTMECLSEIAGHIRWITEIFPVRGGFVSAAEDGFLHLWILGKNNDPSWDIRYMASFELKDCMITAAAPFTDRGVLVTAYDRPQLFWVTLVGRVEEEPIGDDEDTLI